MSASPVAHDHDDTERLTFGCPGCIDRVHQDQVRAALADAPVKTLVIEWEARLRKSGTICHETHVLPGETADDVAERIRDEINELAEEALIETVYDGTEDLDWDVSFENVKAGAASS